MVRECVYRGFCPEMFGCGYDKTEAYAKELYKYRTGKDADGNIPDDACPFR